MAWVAGMARGRHARHGRSDSGGLPEPLDVRPRPEGYLSEGRATGAQRALRPFGSYHARNVHLFSSSVAAITSRLSLAAGTGGDEVKMSYWFRICAAGRAVIAYISIII
jgi:hypothetical protein